MFILISQYVFIENDEIQPIKEIYQLVFLIPVTIYSLFSLWVSFGLFLLLNKIFSYFIAGKMVSKIISFPPSMIIGVPVGLIMLNKILRLITA